MRQHRRKYRGIATQGIAAQIPLRRSGDVIVSFSSFVKRKTKAQDVDRKKNKEKGNAIRMMFIERQMRNIFQEPRTKYIKKDDRVSHLHVLSCLPLRVTADTISSEPATPN